MAILNFIYYQNELMINKKEHYWNLNKKIVYFMKEGVQKVSIIFKWNDKF